MAWAKSFVYYGTSDFSRRILDGLLKAGIMPALVVTTQAKPAGRGLQTSLTPVALLAQTKTLPWLAVKSLKHGLPTEITGTGADFGLLAAFGRILPKELLDLYRFGIINVHPSVLPKYRGASPIQSVLLAGEDITGITLIKLDEEVDHGPILVQAELKIGDSDALDLEAKLAEMAVAKLIQTMPAYLAGTKSLQAQDHTAATFTKQITREDGWADFSLPAFVLNNKRRAFTSWPGLWTSWQGKRLKLIATQPAVASLRVGEVGLSNGLVAVGCGQGSALIIKSLQLADGKTQPGQDFINGHKNFIGSQLPS
ncbi:MAG: Methionyl-tRNA formyltransferase [Parcubacteria group bacterium GW2011_GWD1_42_9]|uniref:methionyl-tRNA formyltransferase n=2 Tax=Candidatus Vebleniibacteriota TaxID=1817921 RepID=A0A1G2Q343_9BACT|nr:MAG: Methionyl-tRNA formyltransferase [Parcubacteria group bacterium GW2011_GWD1_42_9]KKT17710.1 MAG: Methionyl-tRNA formyltransferase [Parcubacteria group bacterium GW2011_GWB1_43_66]KKT28337.1 MAG: Methionyl-tRNA formyltransferase [Parcubacteria group bacterium GW2011_GWF1_43_9]OHA54990.1 MAG: methionyl-tRNA formyltransferase [Candidatus Veblenbacteria bacterium RIFOXYC1_FULL_42_9]OHA57753.1 MAG: methionyl-tRNA formyltransferase [Candidatus Veblenbacteria bacterium RIFOXYD1_FULL_43_11]HAO